MSLLRHLLVSRNELTYFLFEKENMLYNVYHNV
jgi:hypothetical protein